MPTDTLYAEWKQVSPTVRRAVELMDQVQALVGVAIRESTDDPISSDDAMNRVVPILTELFCSRQIGEGFAAVINALLCAAQNKANDKWPESQLLAVLTELNNLRTQPFLKFDVALQAIERLEAAGLIPEPQAFDYLSDWLDGESIR